MFWIKTPFWLLLYFWRKVAIIRSISEVRCQFAGKSPKIRRHGSMGVYGMDASAMFIYFVFDTDDDLKKAEENAYHTKIGNVLLESLKKNGYPIGKLHDDFVSLVSQAAIDRAGSDYLYFK